MANLASGAAGAVLAVVLPPFLLRSLDRDSFSVWSLLLQVGGYVGLLNFGLQTAIGRFVAHAEAAKDPGMRDRIVSTAMAILAWSALLGSITMGGMSILLPKLFPEIPVLLQAQAQNALLLVGGSLALGLPFMALNGVFVGLQRNEIPALLTIGSRVATGLALIIAARTGQGIVALALVFAAVNFMTYVIQSVLFRRFAPMLKLSFKLVSRESIRELVSYCTSLTVWNFAMLLVSGLDLILVARFEFSSVGAFSIATSFLGLLVGSQTAIFNVFLPAGAALHAQGEQGRLRVLLLDTTRWNFLFLGLIIITYCFLGDGLLFIYAGANYVNPISIFLGILLAATVRLSMLPYNILAIGAGDHRQIILGPLAEGLSNLLASIAFGFRFGAIGVAFGTIIGGVVGVAFHLWLNLPRSLHLGIRLETFLPAAFLPGTCCYFLYCLH
ncbi:MAG: hypothetical protein IPP58_00170 [Holophagaceae bacterium]|uniref:Polysaccharide biosynthesis protein C-terminal domain-containing protein n=1 Tax=Candidatus Geothrix skivensis TaxID=2954439 RepID=A0A9D7XJV3_9BACT|nr:hypothetical protein [Candidatus Geothrix skivensis]